MKTIDELLERRTELSEARDTIIKRNPGSTLVKIAELSIQLTDRALRVAAAQQKIFDDNEAADYAWEKAEYNGDHDKAFREWCFYTIRMTYTKIKVLTGNKKADEFLAKIPIPEGYADHIRRGTVPEF